MGNENSKHWIYGDTVRRVPGCKSSTSAFHCSCAHPGLTRMAVASTRHEPQCETSQQISGPFAEISRRQNTHPRYHPEYARALSESLSAERGFG